MKWEKSYMKIAILGIRGIPSGYRDTKKLLSNLDID